MWIAITLGVIVYLSMFPLMWYEWNKRSPYWNARQYWELVQAYWAWPVVFLYIAVMVAWELIRNPKG